MGEAERGAEVVRLRRRVDELEGRLAWLSRAVSEQWPTVPVDLTFVHVTGGVLSTTHWEEDRPPVVGEKVLVSDGRPFLEAVVTAVDGDVLRLQVKLD